MKRFGPATLYEPGEQCPSCPTCGHFACVCAIRAAHEDGCRFLLAAAGSVGIECEHGRDCCPTCDPCTCGGPGR